MWSLAVSTRLGWVGLLRTERGLRRVTLPQPTREEALGRLGGPSPVVPEPFGDLPRRFQRALQGEEVSFTDPLDPEGATPFQRAVWEAARSIPYGETRSYLWVALQIGKPGAARAVGQALGANPFFMVVPCHRVLARDGGLGGFAGGLAMKRRLLDTEALKAPPQS